jgi:hypothetical protein
MSYSLLNWIKIFKKLVWYIYSYILSLVWRCVGIGDRLLLRSVRFIICRVLISFCEAYILRSTAVTRWLLSVVFLLIFFGLLFILLTCYIFVYFLFFFCVVDLVFCLNELWCGRTYGGVAGRQIRRSNQRVIAIESNIRTCRTKTKQYSTSNEPHRTQQQQAITNNNTAPYQR